MDIIIRISRADQERLSNMLFSRYPKKEYGTFLRFGWKHTVNGLVLTLTSFDTPVDGDLNLNNWMTEVTAQYLKRVINLSESHPFAVGFAHSHPEGSSTHPSLLDDDMEEYCSDLLKGYCPDRPFISMIFSKKGKSISTSGRVYYNGQIYEVSKFAIEGERTTLYNFTQKNLLSSQALERVKRLASVFSTQSANDLAGAKVGVVGLSGTGSPVVELLARAGVGNLILVDSDVFADSNLERVHGSVISDVLNPQSKAEIARRHVLSINPECNVTAIKGRIPQERVVDELIWCDIVVGCTDLHSSRVALTELSYRFLLPIIDVGVSMEGKDGNISGQVIQLNRLFPRDPCVYCRGMIDYVMVEQELLDEKEKHRRMQEAENAKRDGRPPNAYWQEMPQLNTVGYLTTTAAGLLSGYIIGYLTGRFGMTCHRIEISILAKGIDVVEQVKSADSGCFCQTCIGTSDQVPSAVISTAPSHWDAPVFI